MSFLHQVLDRLLTWQQHHQPEDAESWLPGLTPDEIADATAALPFHLPKEISEFYQWRNGGSSFYRQGSFYLSLAEAIKEYQNMMKADWMNWNPCWLPIAADEERQGHQVIIGSLEPQAESIVLDIFIESPEPSVMYPSLTNLVLAEVECCEAGVYGEAFSAEAYQMGELIHQKYNPEPNYLDIFGDRLEVTQLNGSRIETYYNQKGEISGVRMMSASGKTEELTYYFRGKPAYRTHHTHEKDGFYHFYRLEHWFGAHDVQEHYEVIGADGWVRPAIERRYIDGILVKDLRFAIEAF